MTDEKCPLSDERLEEIADSVYRDNFFMYNDVLTILRQAAIEGHKIGHEEGYQDAAER